MAKYHVSFTCVWSTVVEADNEIEAENLASLECPSDVNIVDIDGNGYVVLLDENEDEDE